jgi:hypothetical protein
VRALSEKRCDLAVVVHHDDETPAGSVRRRESGQVARCGTPKLEWISGFGS